MPNDMTTESRKASREYYRRWREKNPDKVAAAQERFWSRKAKEYRAESQAAGVGENPDNQDMD